MNITPYGRDYSGNDGSADYEDHLKVGSREWYADIHIYLPENFDTLTQKEQCVLVREARAVRELGEIK